MFDHNSDADFQPLVSRREAWSLVAFGTILTWLACYGAWAMVHDVAEWVM